MNTYLNILGVTVLGALTLLVVAFVVFLVACMLRAYRNSEKAS